MNVVTSAITTSIVKSCCEIMPRSSPMFSTISSVKPRVFISAPIAAESRSEKRLKRAAAIAPTNFPTIATAIRSSVSSQSSGRFSALTSVLRPVTTKKSGSRTRTTKFSNRRVTSPVRPWCRGMISPMMNEPKIAAIPICCATKAESRTADENHAEPEDRDLAHLVVGLREPAQQPAADQEHRRREDSSQDDHLRDV